MANKSGMGKNKDNQPVWISSLRHLMEMRGMNPRSLSLKAGLNATAVRDMLEGRTRFPRYDTVQALAKALGTTPAQLMGGESVTPGNGEKAAEFDEDLDLLTEIITRLQEAAEEHRQRIEPQDFATMVATIYRSVKGKESGRTAEDAEIAKVTQGLVEYEVARSRRASNN